MDLLWSSDANFAGPPRELVVAQEVLPALTLFPPGWICRVTSWSRLFSAPADICLAKTPPDTLEAQPAVHLDDIFRHMPSSSDTNGVGSLWLFLYCKACNRSYTGSGSRFKEATACLLLPWVSGMPYSHHESASNAGDTLPLNAYRPLCALDCAGQHGLQILETCCMAWAMLPATPLSGRVALWHCPGNVPSLGRRPQIEHFIRKVWECSTHLNLMPHKTEEYSRTCCFCLPIVCVKTTILNRIRVVYLAQQAQWLQMRCWTLPSQNDCSSLFSVDFDGGLIRQRQRAYTCDENINHEPSKVMWSRPEQPQSCSLCLSSAAS